jgi:ketosteroid isomerase-like protein
MSQESVEIVRRAAEAAMQPKPDWKTVNALFASDHKLVSRFSALEGGSHEGATGFADFLETVDAMGEWQSTTEDVRPTPDGRVVLISRVRITTQHSGVPLDQQFGTVVTVRDGLIQTSEVYPSAREALEAVGLRE